MFYAGRGGCPGRTIRLRNHRVPQSCVNESRFARRAAWAGRVSIRCETVSRSGEGVQTSALTQAQPCGCTARTWRYTLRTAAIYGCCRGLFRIGAGGNQGCGTLQQLCQCTLSHENGREQEAGYRCISKSNSSQTRLVGRSRRTRECPQDRNWWRSEPEPG